MVTFLIGTSPPVVALEVEGVERAGERRQTHHGHQVAGVVLGLDVGALSAVEGVNSMRFLVSQKKMDH